MMSHYRLVGFVRQVEPRKDDGATLELGVTVTGDDIELLVKSTHNGETKLIRSEDVGDSPAGMFLELMNTLGRFGADAEWDRESELKRNG